MPMLQNDYENDEFVFSVEDEGCGISESNTADLFKSFKNSNFSGFKKFTCHSRQNSPRHHLWSGPC